MSKPQGFVDGPCNCQCHDRGIAAHVVPCCAYAGVPRAAAEAAAEVVRLFAPKRSDYRFILKPSLIPDAGVGCFATTPVPRGAMLSPGYVENFRYLRMAQIPDEYLKFCLLLSSGLYLCPQNFLRMGVFWYVNHAKRPGLVFQKQRLSALRDIAAGEELTLYYSDLLTHPKNKLWVKPSDI